MKQILKFIGLICLITGIAILGLYWYAKLLFLILIQ
jgi:hypothetical protein